MHLVGRNLPASRLSVKVKTSFREKKDRNTLNLGVIDRIPIFCAVLLVHAKIDKNSAEKRLWMEHRGGLQALLAFR